MERKFLEGLGVTDKTIIDAILNQNGAEVSALNTRLKTATEEASTLRNDLITANGKIAELSKVDVTTLQKELEDERKARKEDKKGWSLLSVLTANGCTDNDYIVYKLGSSVEYDDDGAVKDPDKQIKTWKEKFPTFFGTTEPKPTGTGSTGNYDLSRGKTPAKNNPYSKEGWNLTKQMELEIGNPTEAAKLKAEAES